MPKLDFASGKTYGVAGLGKSGKATVQALLHSKAHVMMWDDNASAVDTASAQFAAVAKPYAAWDWSSLEALVMSPGIPLYHPKIHPAVALAQKHDVAVTGDIELLYRAAPEASYIGITGTNGKSTTTTLIAHILKSCGKHREVGGNLGTPVLDLPALESSAFYVLELSSYQLELVASTRFQVGILLNISPDHLDHHGSMESYIAAKRHLFDRQKKKDVAIIGVDDPISAGICKELQAAKQQCVMPISAKQKLGSGVFVVGGLLTNSFALVAQQGDLRKIKSLQGEHNWQNAAAAYAACYVSGCGHEEIMAAMQTYPGLAHRMQWLDEIAGVTFVNDSKATNADAAEKALRTYDNIYWIAGGIAKEGGIAPLKPYFSKIRAAYLIGEAAPDFEKTLKGKVKTSACGTLEHAFMQAAADAEKTGGVVLLSPACASFDQFPNFEVRGEAFMQLVNGWKADHGA